MLVSLTDSKQYEAVKNDLIGTINRNINEMFKKSVAVQLDETERSELKLIFSIPCKDSMLTYTICLPGTIINSKQFLNKE